MHVLLGLASTHGRNCRLTWHLTFTSLIGMDVKDEYKS